MLSLWNDKVRSLLSLTELLIEILNTEMRVSDVVIVVGDPRCFTFLGKTGFVVCLDNVQIIYQQYLSEYNISVARPFFGSLTPICSSSDTKNQQISLSAYVVFGRKWFQLCLFALADLRRDARDAPPSSFDFMHFSGNLQNRVLALPPQRVGAPTLSKS